jgi:hypothetical protein
VPTCAWAAAAQLTERPAAALRGAQAAASTACAVINGMTSPCGQADTPLLTAHDHGLS